LHGAKKDEASQAAREQVLARWYELAAQLKPLHARVLLQTENQHTEPGTVFSLERGAIQPLDEQTNELECFLKQHPWFSQERLALPAFIQQARVALASITTRASAFEQAYRLFEERQPTRVGTSCQENAHPTVDDLVELLRALEQALGAYQQILDQHRRLPLVLLPLRIPVLVELAALHDTLWKALFLLGRVRSQQRQTSTMRAMEQPTLLTSLETVCTGTQEVLQLSQFLFDQVHFAVCRQGWQEL